MHYSASLIFNNTQTWGQSVQSADTIYQQVQQILEDEGKMLPQTLRRPDARLILENNTGETIYFINPGNHAKEATEAIPADGKSKAVMVMLKGDTLEQQIKNAKFLTDKFGLLSGGLTKEFAQALGGKETNQYVAEAYGPAPFSTQSDKLVELKWDGQNKQEQLIIPVKTSKCAYGVREAGKETVFSTAFEVFVKGTNTIAECVEGTSMCIAVAQDWETGAISTRPIVPSIAKEFYGAHYDSMPHVSVGTDGKVKEIDLMNGEDPIRLNEKQAYDDYGCSANYSNFSLRF